MGISILELVLQRLREENFLADVAFPGQKFPAITEPVAAVHIEKVDRANLTVTVEVSIICPAQMGGTQCELEALRATEVLRWAGATCIQNGCRYDGMAQVYVVDVQATFTCVTGAQDCTLGPGFQIFILEELMPYALSFEAQQVRTLTPQYEMGQDAPVGTAGGSWYWTIRLEELIPTGSIEVDDIDATFQLRLESETVTETYYDCRWTEIRREYTRQGLRRIRSGISLMRLEEMVG